MTLSSSRKIEEQRRPNHHPTRQASPSADLSAQGGDGCVRWHPGGCACHAKQVWRSKLLRAVQALQLSAATRYPRLVTLRLGRKPSVPAQEARELADLRQRFERTLNRRGIDYVWVADGQSGGDGLTLHFLLLTSRSLRASEVRADAQKIGGHALAGPTDPEACCAYMADHLASHSECAGPYSGRFGLSAGVSLCLTPPGGD